MTRRFAVADLFCGAGGTSTGCLRAVRELGAELDLVAINHWETAIATHTLNHPFARHFCINLDAANPAAIVEGGRLDLLLASPECFPAGTLILSDRGLVPIEDVVIGARVLTHQGRWQPVTEVMSDERTRWLYVARATMALRSPQITRSWRFDAPWRIAVEPSGVTGTVSQPGSRQSSYPTSTSGLLPPQQSVFRCHQLAAVVRASARHSGGWSAAGLVTDRYASARTVARSPSPVGSTKPLNSSGA